MLFILLRFIAKLFLQIIFCYLSIRDNVLSCCELNLSYIHILDCHNLTDQRTKVHQKFQNKTRKKEEKKLEMGSCGKKSRAQLRTRSLEIAAEISPKY